MRIFTNSNKYKPNIRIKHQLVNLPQQADCLILVRENDDLLKYLCGVFTIIDAGSYDQEAEMIISEATSQGVPEENILVCADDGGCIDYAEIEQILDKMPEPNIGIDPEATAATQESITEIKTGLENTDQFWSVTSDSPIIEQPAQEKIQELNTVNRPENPRTPPKKTPLATVIDKPNKNNSLSVIGFHGGLGRTLIATGLSGTYAGFGEKVALVDLGKPAYTPYYMGLPKLVEEDFGYFARTKWGDIFIPKSSMKHKLLTHLADYKRIIYDLPAYVPNEYHEEIFASNKLLIVDHDIRTLKMTKERINFDQLENIHVVINKVPVVNQGSYSYVVGSELKIMPILEIPLDEKCSAYIDKYAPVVAENGSSIIAMKIGELAGIMNHEMEGEISHVQGF